MRSFLDVFKEELALIIADKSILLTCIIAPVFYAFFVGSIYKEKDVANIPIAIVDNDHSSLSRKVGQLIDSNEKIRVTGSYSNLNDAMFLFNSLDIQGILIIPNEFEKKNLKS